ncbi:MAG: IS21 family transposase [Phycisphaeraceae bacterium]
MANQLRVAEIQSILTLYERGWSCRRIARELGVHRETVGRYVQQARAPSEVEVAKPAKALSGSAGGDGEAKPAKAPTGSPPEWSLEPEGIASSAGRASPGRAVGPEVLSRTLSACRPYHAIILAKLEQGLSAVRIQQDLATDQGSAPGEAPSYHSVRRYIQRLGAACPVPFRRMECAPGLEAQVDFGRGASIVAADGRKRRPHVLRVILSHSRKGYSQAVERQTTENFIRALEDALHHFGGVPQTLVLDNLKAAVQKADWFDPEINPKVQSFCAHYGIVPLPTKPRMPRHKGKVERGVDYVQENALKGHQFASLAEQNRHLREWEATVADTRIHGTTRQQVGQVFAQVEKPALQPLPAERFPCFHEGQRTVHRDGHVEVDKAYYSVPPEYLGRLLWARWDSRLVRIFNPRMQLIATHVRKEAGQFSTQDRHILDQKITGVERGAAWLLQRAGIIGLQAQRWAQAMVQARGIEGVRVLQGLLSLADKHPHDRLNQACGIALEHQAWRLRTLRRLVQRGLHHADRQQNLPELLDEHPIIRSLAEYGQFVHASFLQPLPGMETGS